MRYVISIAFLVCCGSLRCGEIVAQERPQSTKVADEKTGPGPSKSEKMNFVRILREKDQTPIALQTGITPYSFSEGNWKGCQVDLIGAVHIGHRSYYQELNRKFARYDAVLYELVADREVNVPQKEKDGNVRHPIGAVQVGMKDMLGLEFQLDEINYHAKNFVHADMSPQEFSQDMAKRGDGFVAMFSRMMGAGIVNQAAQANKGQDIQVLSALFSKNREVRLRQTFAEQFENVDAQLVGLADASGRSTLLTERNAKAFEVLKEQIKLGKKKIAIFYGAGHLLDMDQRLINDHQAHRGETEWLTAWRLQE